MGTLFDQPIRRKTTVSINDLDRFLAEAVRLAKKHKIPVDDVIDAQAVLESERMNEFCVLNANVLDEQLAGFGEILWRISGCLEKWGDK
jgi:hypothetical protein